MRTTRRDLLKRAGWMAGAATLAPLRPPAVRAQDGDAALTERLHADLVAHAGFGRKFSGGPGDLATANWIASRVREAGYDAAVSTFDAPFFAARVARISTGLTAADIIPQGPVVPTGSRGVTARLAIVEDGRIPDAVRGCIALVATPFARHAALFRDRGIGQTVAATAGAGAAAIVIVTNGPSGEAVALNAPEQPFVPIPAAVLAPRHAAPFMEAARTGREATLVIDGDATHRPSPNIVARRVRGPRWIAMSTPRSGWFDCVGERGTGTAAFLELASVFATRFPGHSLFLMNTGGHEYFFAGSHRVLHEAPPPEATDVWVHIGATLAARDAEERDGRLVMLDTADPQRSLMTTGAARAACLEAFQGISGLAEPVGVRPQAGELSTFTDRGYANAFAAIGVHRWFHTVEDTLERVDARLLRPVVRAHARAVELIVASRSR